MVVTTPKPWDEVRFALGDGKRWVVMGCADCAAVCQTGGSSQVDELAERMQDEGFEVLARVDLPSPCDRRLTRRDLKRVARELEAADGVVCLTCGGGVQAVAELVGKPVVAGLDAHFVGTVERVGVFHEQCALCGACVLNETAGICPVTGCPKGLRNGPCEEANAGACEAEPGLECVWERIWERLEALGRAEAFGTVRPPAPPVRRPRSTGRRTR
ncbi:methylenetetrahydrofolate reductase C-terminal domain-containing protein [Deferrisoma camini]|uniref:methylenetetrahydrofolate reductase C-terminal domain-containing protein n=1 Tax=Deferrisoma camini TaxID=1035120 RepID=UPI00046D867A|nr:methylenetetrahydrofolate reductase C-terminal domain-containing protein [Deferrisoma camini]